MVQENLYKIRNDLRNIMDKNVGVFRNEKQLQSAEKEN